MASCHSWNANISKTGTTLVAAWQLPRLAPEARQIIAHGETVGLVRQKSQAPAGAV